AMNEVGRAVRRIDDPLKLGAIRPLQAELLAQHSVVGIRGAQSFDNGFLSGTIDIRDIIARSLARHADSFQVQAGTVDDGAGTPGRLDGDIEHRVHKIPYVCNKAHWERRGYPNRFPLERQHGAALPQWRDKAPKIQDGTRPNRVF